jgi:WD40 repeat protein
MHKIACTICMSKTLVRLFTVPRRSPMGQLQSRPFAFTVLGDVMLVAAVYQDGCLVIYDVNDGSVRENLPNINTHESSCSVDGRTLACTDTSGAIQLVDMETSKLIYRLELEADQVPSGSITFTSDSHRIIEIRAKQCRLWDPAVLIRQDLDDENNSRYPLMFKRLDIGDLRSHVSRLLNVFQTHPLSFAVKKMGQYTSMIYQASRIPRCRCRSFNIHTCKKSQNPFSLST